MTFKSNQEAAQWVRELAVKTRLAAMFATFDPHELSERATRCEEIATLLERQAQPPVGTHSVCNQAIEILDRNGQLRWRGVGLEPSGDGTFVVTLDRTFLTQGEHRFQLYGLKGTSSSKVAEYLIRIE